MTDQTNERPVDADGMILTFTGRPFHTLRPRPEEVHVPDIAHALALQCRFNGHVFGHYSVAEHCARVALAVAAEHPDQAELQLAALMHDAGEAYLGDIVAPLKRALKAHGFAEIEEAVDVAICSAIDLDVKLLSHPSVKLADRRMLTTEQRDLRGLELSQLPIGEAAYEPYPETIQPLSPDDAELYFTEAFVTFQRRRAGLTGKVSAGGARSFYDDLQAVLDRACVVDEVPR